ncbi:hypothetical protein ScPMuIL_005969 [Solemya velum]
MDEQPNESGNNGQTPYNEPIVHPTQAEHTLQGLSTGGDGEHLSRALLDEQSSTEQTIQHGDANMSQVPVTDETRTELLVQPDVLSPEIQKQNAAFELSLTQTSKGVVVHSGANVNLTLKGQYIQLGGEGSHNEIKLQHVGGTKSKLEKLFDKTRSSIDHWRKNDGQLFLATPALEKCRALLDTEGHVNIFGLSGHGKSTLAFKLMEESKRRAIILRRPEDWEEIDVESENPLVVLDDMFGRFELDRASKDKWLTNLSSMYWSVKERKLQVVVTCRETIFSICEKELGQCDLFKPTCCVHLTHVGYDLNIDVKLQMVKKYIDSRLAVQKISLCEKQNDENLEEFQISQPTLEKIVNTNTPLGFPQCCRFFVTQSHCFFRGVDFFKKPVEAVLLEIDRMHNSENDVDKYNYCTLACVLIYGGLTDERLENIDDSLSDHTVKVETIAKACRIKSFLSSEVQIAARRLTTSYLTYTDETYSFKHNSITEAVFTSFSKWQPKLLVEHCDIDLLYNLITTKGSVVRSDMLFTLPTRYYALFCARLARELTDNNRSLWRVVSNSVMSDAQFVDTFWAYVESQPKTKSQILQSTYSGLSILFVSGRMSFGCFVGRLVEALRDSMPTDQLEGELGRALYGACVYGNYSVCEYLTERYRHWATYDISNALWQACHNSKFDCYKCLIEYSGCNTREVVTHDVMTAAASGARSTKDSKILSDLASRGFEIPHV